jgi:hypothetical protein
MHHLKLEELARLVDEPPTEAETDHLEGCARCAADLEELRLQTTLLAQMPDPVMPDTVRIRIAQVVEAEAAPVRLERGFDRGWMSVAAAVLMFVIGGVTGTFVIAPGLAPQASVVERAAPSGGAAEAANSLVAAEAAYLQALANFARLNYSGDGLDPLNRLAALEGIVLTTRSALREAPADPVINNYHLTALGQRDELLRQIEEVDEADEWF